MYNSMYNVKNKKISKGVFLMILAVDVGNTHVVLGVLDGLETKHMFRMQTDINRTDAEYAVVMHQMLSIAGYSADDFEGAIISSVVPPLTGLLKHTVKLVTGKDALVVGPGLKTGLNIRIDDPATLGADLVAGAVAALYKYTAPLIVIDMGTATTVTCIDKNGGFLGGAIAAGVTLCLNALSAGTSQLPSVDLSYSGKAIGSNTIDCMRSGAVYGTACMLDGLIDRMQEELGGPATIVACGGLAPKITPHCRHDIHLETDLLMLGLGLIYRKNVRK